MKFMSRAGSTKFNRLLTMSVAAALVAACGSSEAAEDQAAPVAASAKQVALPPSLCQLLPQADAERIMGRALVVQRNDEWACHYRDARGTEFTGLWLNLNVFFVADQCKLVEGSVPLSGVGDEACIAANGLYTDIVFGKGGRTFEVTAPGQNRDPKMVTEVANVVMSKLGT